MATDTETYLTPDDAGAELAQSLIATGQLHLVNAAALHSMGLELEVLVDEHDVARGLRLTRLPTTVSLYTDEEHEAALARLAGHGSFSNAWRGLSEQARRMSMWQFGGR